MTKAPEASAIDMTKFGNFAGCEKFIHEEKCIHGYRSS